jgi:hypothetical protein
MPGRFYPIRGRFHRFTARFFRCESVPSPATGNQQPLLTDLQAEGRRMKDGDSCSAFILQPSSFSLHPSAFILQPLTHGLNSEPRFHPFWIVN